MEKLTIFWIITGILFFFFECPTIKSFMDNNKELLKTEILDSDKDNEISLINVIKIFLPFSNIAAIACNIIFRNNFFRHFLWLSMGTLGSFILSIFIAALIIY